MISAIYRNRDFGFLWAAQILSTLGNELYSIGMIVTIFDQSGSALQAAGVLVARTMPSLLISPFAGALVDRYPRQRVMVVMSLFRALLTGLVLLVIGTDGVSAWAGYAVVFGLATAGVFYKPAQQATVPILVPESGLVRANSLLMTTDQAILVASYGMGGVLILWLGFAPLVAVGLTSFLLAAGFASRIHCPACFPEEPAGYGREPLLRSVRDGLRYLRDHRLARPLLIMETLEYWPHGIWTSALMLAFTRQALGAGTAAWGYQASAFFAGQLAGAALAIFVSRQLTRHAGWVIIFNAFLFGLLTLGYALSPTVVVAVVLSFAFGPPSAMRDVTQDSLLQASVGRDVLGRIYATRDVLTQVSYMLAGVGFAWMADQVPVRWVYVIGGCLYLGTAVYALSNRAIRGSRLVEGERAATDDHTPRSQPRH
jgi:MFS family permease